jgi:hypothetical protein
VCFVFKVIKFVAQEPHLLIFISEGDFLAELSCQLANFFVCLNHLFPHDLVYFFFMQLQLLLDVWMYLVDEAVYFLVSGCDFLLAVLKGRFYHFLKEG